MVKNKQEVVMRRFKNIALALLTLSITLPIQADEIQDVHNIWGVLHKVVSPNEIIVKFEKNEKQYLVGMSFHALKVPEKYNKECNPDKPSFHCNYIEESLKGETLGLVIEGKTDSIVKGDVIVDGGGSFVIDALLSGHYKLNGRVSRSKVYIDAEQKARCSLSGSWSVNAGNPMVAKQCQSI